MNESFFDDAVFVGDSVSLKLNYYVTGKRNKGENCLGKARFLTSGSLGWGNLLWDVSNSKAVHPSYNGKKQPVEDSIAQMGAKKIYIMLGVNDINVYGIDGTVGNAKTVISKILAKSPDVKIYVQSVTPLAKGREKNGLNNAAIRALDDKLRDMCAALGYNFVDVASVMRDGEGNLPVAYCSDPNGMGIHFTDAACAKWIEYLYSNAR